VTIYLDNETEEATTVLYTDGVTKNDVDLYLNAVIVRHDTGSSITPDEMDAGEGTDDNIKFTVSAASGGNLTVDSGFELHVWTSDTFDASGGNVTTQGAGGDLHLDDSSTFTGGTTEDHVITNDVTIDTSAALTAPSTVDNGTIKVGGSWANSGSFTEGLGKVTFTADSGTHTVNNGSSDFYDLTFGDSASTAEWDATSALDIDGDLSLAYGTLDINGSNTVNLAGVLSFSSGTTYSKSTGAFTFDDTGSHNYTDSTAGIQSLGDVIIDAESSTRTVTLTTDIEMDNLTIATDGVFAMSTNDVTIGDDNDASSGDINVTGSGASSQFANGTVTILSDSGTTQWNGAGTFTAYNLNIGDGSNTFTIDNETNDLNLNIIASFTITTNAIFSASSTANFTVKEWTNNGIFTANEGLVRAFSEGGSPAFAGTMTGSSAFYNLEFDDEDNDVDWSFSANATVTNDFTITGGTITAPAGTLSVGHDFDNDDTFVNNSGTVTLSGAADTTQTITSTANLPFYNLTATTGDRIIKFEASRQFDIAASGTLTLTGTDCTNLIMIRSTSDGTAFVFDVDDPDGNFSASYIDVQDSNNGGLAITATNSVDSDNNTNWTIAANYCIGASQDALDTATGYSFQRKTFWDSANERYWLFYHDGTHIEVRYSSDASTWNVDDDILDYNTNDFSVWWKQISGVEYVWLAVTSGNDIVVRQGSLGINDVSWDLDVSTALDGDTDSYSYPYISLDSLDYLWVGARNYDGSTNYNYKTATTYEGGGSQKGNTDPSTWDWTASPHQLSDDQADSNVFGNVVPLSGQDMYATFVVDTALEGCIWDYDHDPSARWEDSSDNACTPTEGEGGGGGEYELRDSDGPNKIDDAGNPGVIAGAGRKIVQTSGGTLYSVINDGGSFEVWMSVNGETWTDQDSSNNPTGGGANNPLHVAIDDADDLHLLYWVNVAGDAVVKYVKFTTSTNTFGTPETVKTYTAPDLAVVNDLAIAIDSTNGEPHAVISAGTTNFFGDDYEYIDYTNRVSGSWKAVVTIESNSHEVSPYSYYKPDITLNDDDYPEIVYLNSGDDDLTGAYDASNNPSSFTLHDIDTDVDAFGDGSASIAVDQAGNTWVAYSRNDTVDDITLAKHTGTTWTTNWTIDITNNNRGYGASIAIITSDIYVFYQDDTSPDQRIVYDRYDSGNSTWLNETALATPSGDDYQDVHARWSYLNNNDGYFIDYLFSDGTDV